MEKDLKVKIAKGIVEANLAPKLKVLMLTQHERLFCSYTKRPTRGNHWPNKGKKTIYEEIQWIDEGSPRTVHGKGHSP